MKYEAKVKYVHLDQLSGKEKTVSETYLLDAETFGDAEEKTMKYMAEITDATVIATIKKSDIEDVVGDIESDRFYKSFVKVSTIDELTGKESTVNFQLLIGCKEFKDAFNESEVWCNASIFNAEITKIATSSISGIIKN